jgi:hypothetical protein
MQSTVVQYDEICRPARLRRRIAGNAWRLDNAGRELVENLLVQRLIRSVHV